MATKKKTIKRKPALRPYLVLCEPRIVLMGYATPAEIKKKSPTLKDSRMCVRWSADVRGVLGLAKNGPTASCRISPAVPEHTVRTKIEATLPCTKEAEAAWEKEPWA